MQLEKSRQEIDRIDGELVALLARRIATVRDIGSYKRGNVEAPFRDADREQERFEAWFSAAEAAGLSTYFAGRILREILNYSRRVQEGLLESEPSAPDATGPRVGYLGEAGAYSDLALSKLFASRDGQTVRKVGGFGSFTEVIDALEAGEVDRAFLPIENTIAGSLNEVYHLLAMRSVKVVDEEILRIEHCLAALPGVAESEIRVVRSHPVALQQCRKLLGALGGAVSEGVRDTASAARSVAEERRPEIASICSEEAARANGLVVLRRDVSDQRNNFTRFLLISLTAEATDPRQPSKTSILFSVNHRHGALAECLQAFARRGISLSKLESRHLPDSPWEYLFYADLDAHGEAPEVVEAFAEVRGYTNSLEILGTYPRRADELEAVPARVADRPRLKLVGDGPRASTCAPSAGLPHCSRSEGQPGSEVKIGTVAVGGRRFVLMAGPCAVESRAQIERAAGLVKERGGAVLRGGAFKPRSSPYSFQGLGFAGVDLLCEAGRAYELPVVTEVLRSEDVERVAAKADALQVGARNMHNFALLKRLGSVQRPVVLKRGLSATIDELLSAAEYIMDGGNHRVILCERGIRTFESSTRSTLDVSAVPVLKRRTHLPVIVDPSHAAGDRELVVPLALAAVAAGADGLLVEVHPNPEEALCDKEQALNAADLEDLVARLRPILEAQGRSL